MNQGNNRGMDGNAFFIFRHKNKEFSAWLLSLYSPWCTDYFVRKGPTEVENGRGYMWATRAFPLFLDMYKQHVVLTVNE